MIELLLHSFVDTFAAGRSSIKLILFFLYLFILCSVYFFRKKNVIANVKKTFNYYLVGISVGYIYGVLIHIFFYYQNSLPFLTYVITFGQHDLSTTSLFHNHITKSGFGIIQNFFSSKGVGVIDAGSAYQAYIPLPLALPLIIICAFVIYYCFKLFSQYIPEKKLLWTFAYAVITFSLFKNIFDGGLFNYEFLPSFMFFLLLMRSNISIKHKPKIYIGIIIYICLLFTLLSLSPGGFIQYVSKFILCIISIGSIWLLSETQKVNLKIKEKYMLILFLITFIAGGTYFRAKEMIEYHNIDLEYEYTYGKQKNGEIEFHAITDNKKYKKVGEVLKDYNLIDNYYPLSVPWKTCVPLAGWNKESFVIVSEESHINTTFKNTKYTFAIEGLKEQKRDNNIYKAILTTDPCIPLHLNILASSLKKVGFNNSIIYHQEN